MWKAHKLVTEPSSDRGRTRIPTLVVEWDRVKKDLIANEKKSEALYRTFFPLLCAENIELDQSEYSDPVCPFKNITDEQIIYAINRLQSYKGIMPNDIANIILKKAKTIIMPYLGPIYWTTFTLKMYPPYQKIYDIYVTRKPGKTNYTIPKAYQPTCLLKTLEKLLSIAIAKYLNNIIERH